MLKQWVLEHPLQQGVAYAHCLGEAGKERRRTGCTRHRQDEKEDNGGARPRLNPLFAREEFSFFGPFSVTFPARPLSFPEAIPPRRQICQALPGTVISKEEGSALAREKRRRREDVVHENIVCSMAFRFFFFRLARVGFGWRGGRELSGGD